jgi:nucleoside phosphorylase
MNRPSSPPDLLVVALWAEALPLLARMRQRRRRGRGLYSGRLAGRPVLLLHCGLGSVPAAQATERVLGRHDVGAVLSVGTCGALVDGLRVGDLVTAERILDLDGAQPRPLPGVRPVVLATVPRVVHDPEQRAHWAQLGAEVCEMEAAGVAAKAAGHPFLTLKVVSDLAGARPARIRGLPRRVRRLAFQGQACRLMHRQLAPVLEAWIGRADE